MEWRRFVTYLWNDPRTCIRDVPDYGRSIFAKSGKMSALNMVDFSTACARGLYMVKINETSHQLSSSEQCDVLTESQS